MTTKSIMDKVVITTMVLGAGTTIGIRMGITIMRDETNKQSK